MVEKGDRIYIAKYYEKLGGSEIAKSFCMPIKRLEEEIESMKKEGVYEKYKEMSDEEWEKFNFRENEDRTYRRRKK